MAQFLNILELDNSQLKPFLLRKTQEFRQSSLGLGYGDTGEPTWSLILESESTRKGEPPHDVKWPLRDVSFLTSRYLSCAARA